MVDFTPAPIAGDLDVRWIHGGAVSDPPLQAHAYDEHTYILRQSKSVDYEAPFLYLLFGNERAILFDTGATASVAEFPVHETVDGIVESWLSRHTRRRYHLIVAHTHGHGDHIAGDSQFTSRRLTTVVGTALADVAAFFGFTDWPFDTARFDLGGRVLDVAAIPGHEPSAIAVFDPWTGFLLTGDTVYPGRLYADDMPTYIASMDRLVEFADARAVTHVMGCHIEMTRTPGIDYPLGTTYQPDEPPLPMTIKQLHSVRHGAHGVADRPGRHVFDDFILYNGPTL
jgi:glyoxylase-like metal-dependent hydrolase (beta-lactamase superfamily II)